HKRVAFLDTDVGQPEFSPPGCLSLTILDRETNIDSQVLPERCFFFGDISCKRDPQIYLTCICSLYDHYHKHHHQSSTRPSPSNSGVPLIVNTPGWVKGIGYDVLVDILKHVTPSHVVNICISAKRKNLPSGAFWSQDGDAGAATLIEINSARQDSLNRSVLVQKDSRHLRDLSIVKYFTQCFSNDMNLSSVRDIAGALASHSPYEVSVSAVKIKHLHCEVPKAEIFYSLNATIVGLAVDSEGAGDLPRCVGLGIVRGIDTLRKVLYIITPVSPSVLEDVDVLLQGFIQIPTCLLQFLCTLNLIYSLFLEFYCTMTASKRTFRMFVEEELGIFPHFVVWAVLEWMLIISLYLDGFLSFISNKFADIFELDPPCVLCTRVDHALCGTNPNLYYNESICDSHKKDISSLAYCRVHRKLSDIRTMCESCLVSFATEKEPDSDPNRDSDDDNRPLWRSEKKVKDGNKPNGMLDANLCSCCGESLKPKQPAKEYSRSLSNIRSSSLFPNSSPRALFPTSSPRAFSSLAPLSSPRASTFFPPSSPRAFSSMFPSSSPRASSLLAPSSPRAFFSQNRFTELKFVSDNEPDMPEDDNGSNTNMKQIKDVKTGTLTYSDEMNDDGGKTPSYTKGNKFVGIPLTEPAAISPGLSNKLPKKTTLEKPDLFTELAEEPSADCYSVLQQLKKQVSDNKKTLVTLYLELDEERSAATVAANNAMAMITRLQAEKAGVHMEALQYQRMMDEQAEYDEEAIQILKDLLLKKEEDVRIMEAELDAYRERYGDIKKNDTDEYDEYYDELQPRSLSSFGEKSDSESVADDHNVDENKKENHEESSVTFESERSQLFGMLKDFEKHVHSSSKIEHCELSNNTGDHGDNATLRREVNLLREKLAAIEAESGFLKQTAMTLEKGDEGTKLLTEIAEHLRKLQG
nr:probable myosin-binding protein 5 [Tanacetum cinerariifolium]